MASQLINLNQLRTTVINIKTYTDKKYALSDHNHDSKYASFIYVDSALISLEEKLEDKAIKDHTHTSADVMTMKNYVIASELDSIMSGDSLNTAIGKLEYGLKNSADKYHTHDGIYLGINDTAVAAKQLDKSIEIELSGEVFGSTTLDGTSDITISTTINNLSSEKIASMSGYIRPDSADPISERDSLNTAIGKLEYAIELQKDNAIDVNALKEYTDMQITELIGGDDIPESLNTLRELAAAINDNPTFGEFVESSLASKAETNHIHELATDANNGFMSASDKYKLDNIENEANLYIHPDSEGNKHIPAGGQSEQILVWSNYGEAQWSEISTLSATDAEVNNILDSIFPTKE